MNARAHYASAFADRLQGARDQVAYWRKDDSCAERLRRRFVRSSRPGCTKATGKGLRRQVCGTRESKYRAALPFSDLGKNVRSRPEAVKAQEIPVARDGQRAPANESRTEQGCT